MTDFRIPSFDPADVADPAARARLDELTRQAREIILARQDPDTGLLPANRKDNGPDDINWTAGFAGALAISPSDASPQEAPRKGDLDTARLLGSRVAEFAERLRG